MPHKLKRLAQIHTSKFTNVYLVPLLCDNYHNHVAIIAHSRKKREYTCFAGSTFSYLSSLHKAHTTKLIMITRAKHPLSLTLYLY